jgi:hypothetical protein
MENHVGVMVVCLPTYKRDVCHRFSTRKGTASIGEDAGVYVDSCTDHGNIFTKNPQAFLELDL